MSYKKYYDNNIEQILERKHEYYLENRTQIAEQKKRYYTLNRDIILGYNKKRVLCDCGSIVSYSNLARHFKSNKHKDFLNIQ